ncbi:(2Fe-2S)-binding protein [Roseateles chitosanitabidus]|uniref:(2Fe-2S)-binding protein n=1 Tax=Roseateles chitosanitabidus TaxID=65048 RepID=UPI00082CF86A|nr:(2Fe-2S)-binding protein [Roseateles chitosanitabidus]
MPSLRGHCELDVPRGDPPALAAGPSAERLVAALRARDPDAGRAYWALRAWARLVWQPTYASVLGVELAGGVVPLDGLRWQVDADEADVSGFTLPASRFARPLPGPDRALAATQLRTLAATLLASVQTQLPLHPKAARRLLADCVLAALLRARPLTRLTDEAMRALGAEWLALLEATGDSGYLAYDTATGDSRLALDRGVCCLDDRRAGGELCNTCPRLSRAERLRRLGATDLRNSA